MTTIVGDWGRKVLVSDTQYSDDDTGIKYHEEKVFPIPDGWFGGAGHKSDIEKVLAWVRGEATKKPKIKNSNSFLMLTSKGLFSTDNTLEWETVNTFLAIGSGAMAAEALLRKGFSAEEAVQGACDVDLSSSEPIKLYELNQCHTKTPQLEKQKPQNTQKPTTRKTKRK
jgi:20S proteasome alpha/beta subunit